MSKAQPGLDVDSLYQMGLTAYQEGRVEDAVRSWRAAVSSDPGRLGIRHSLGWALYELGMRNEAMAEFLVILREHPDDPDAVAAVELIQGESEPGLATEGSGR
jgi:tetratricopeptide (TPR) repeat protein